MHPAILSETSDLAEQFADSSSIFSSFILSIHGLVTVRSFIQVIVHVDTKSTLKGSKERSVSAFQSADWPNFRSQGLKLRQCPAVHWSQPRASLTIFPFFWGQLYRDFMAGLAETCAVNHVFRRTKSTPYRLWNWGMFATKTRGKWVVQVVQETWSSS